VVVVKRYVIQQPVAIGMKLLRSALPELQRSIKRPSIKIMDFVAVDTLKAASFVCLRTVKLLWFGVYVMLVRNFSVVLVSALMFCLGLSGIWEIQRVKKSSRRGGLEVLPKHVFDLGVVKTNSAHTILPRIRNDGESSYTLTSIQTSCGCTSADIGLPRILSPGESCEIPITWRTGGKVGRFKQTILVEFTEPQLPELKAGFITVLGNVHE
jgi:hypothetical protein